MNKPDTKITGELTAISSNYAAELMARGISTEMYGADTFWEAFMTTTKLGLKTLKDAGYRKIR